MPQVSLTRNTSLDASRICLARRLRNISAVSKSRTGSLMDKGQKCLKTGVKSCPKTAKNRKIAKIGHDLGVKHVLPTTLPKMLIAVLSVNVTVKVTVHYDVYCDFCNMTLYKEL